MGATDGAGKVDLAEDVDEAGYGTRIPIAYWDGVPTFDRWTATTRCWTAPERARQGVGFFAEVLRPPVERFETLFASQRLEGSASWRTD